AYTRQTDAAEQVARTITGINGFATQIVNLNKQISQVETGGMKANDLRDQRDQLMDGLSSLVKFNSVESATGAVSIFIGNHALVDREQVHAMGIDAASGKNQPVWTDVTPNPAVVTSDGKLQGLIQVRDVTIQNRIDSM